MPLCNQKIEVRVANFESRDLPRVCALRGAYIGLEWAPNLREGVQRRFIQSIKDFCYGILAQVDVRPTASVPDIGEYLALRRMSVGTYPCFALIE